MSTLNEFRLELGITIFTLLIVLGLGQKIWDMIIPIFYGEQRGGNQHMKEITSLESNFFRVLNEKRKASCPSCGQTILLPKSTAEYNNAVKIISKEWGADYIPVGHKTPLKVVENATCPKCNYRAPLDSWLTVGD